MASTVWKGRLIFSGSEIPITLSIAARAETIECSQVHVSDTSPVKQVLYCEAEDKAVPREQIGKLFHHDGRDVLVEDEDFERSKPTTTKTICMLGLVKYVGLTYFRDHYHVMPDGPDERAYAVLFWALKRSQLVGLTKITMYRREHLAAICSGEHGIMLHTLYHAAEVRSLNEFRTNVSIATETEVDSAVKLMRRAIVPFEPEKFTDAFRTNFLKIMTAKAAGQPPKKRAVSEKKSPARARA